MEANEHECCYYRIMEMRRPGNNAILLTVVRELPLSIAYMFQSTCEFEILSFHTKAMGTSISGVHCGVPLLGSHFQG